MPDPIHHPTTGFTDEPATDAHASEGCTACDLARRSGARFCPVCGAALAMPVADNASTAVVEVGPLEGEPPKRPQHQSSTAPLELQPEPSDEAEPPAHVCTCACGQELPPEARYCFRCGNLIGTVTPAYELRVVGDSSSAGRAQMVDGELNIGKDPGCDLTLDDDEFVSRRHARICRDDGLLFLEDLGSSNGTYLRVRRPINLETGDEILIGKTVLRLEQR